METVRKKWKMPTIINRVSRPFPLGSPLTFDYIPLLGFQRKVDAELQVAHLSATGSVTKPRDVFGFKSRDHDIEFKRVIGNPKGVEAEFDGSPDNNITQEQFFKEARDELGVDFMDFNIQCRVPLYKAPSNIDLPVDRLLAVEQKVGDFTRSLRKRFGLKGISRWYEIAKDELLNHDAWEKYYRHKLRGVLKQRNIVGFDGKLRSLPEILQAPEGHRFSRQHNELNRGLIKDKWWQDTGIPVKMYGAINNTEIEAVVYALHRRSQTASGYVITSA